MKRTVMLAMLGILGMWSMCPAFAVGPDVLLQQDTEEGGGRPLFYELAAIAQTSPVELGLGVGAGIGYDFGAVRPLAYAGLVGDDFLVSLDARVPFGNNYLVGGVYWLNGVMDYRVGAGNFFLPFLGWEASILTREKQWDTLQGKLILHI